MIAPWRIALSALIVIGAIAFAISQVEGDADDATETADVAEDKAIEADEEAKQADADSDRARAKADEAKRQVVRITRDLRAAGIKGDPGESIIGRRGPQGPGPTLGEIAAAVVAYCGARNECRGPQGLQGPQGLPGADATIEQVSAAVAAYCAERDECRGPQGPGPTQAEIAAAVEEWFDTHTWTCDFTADPDDSPTAQTCTAD